MKQFINLKNGNLLSEEEYIALLTREAKELWENNLTEEEKEDTSLSEYTDYIINSEGDEDFVELDLSLQKFEEAETLQELISAAVNTAIEFEMNESWQDINLKEALKAECFSLSLSRYAHVCVYFKVLEELDEEEEECLKARNVAVKFESVCTL